MTEFFDKLLKYYASVKPELVEGIWKVPHLLNEFEVSGTVLNNKLTGWGSYLYPKAISQR